MTEPTNPPSEPSTPTPTRLGPVNYYDAPPRMSRMAITSMVLGIISLVPLLMTLLAIPAIVLGVLARREIHRRPSQLAGTGFANAGIATATAGLLIFDLVLIMDRLPDGHRELANRSYCASNIRSTIQAMTVYATDNSGAFPLTESGGGPGTYQVSLGVPRDIDAAKTINYLFTTTPGGITPANNTNPSQILWMLALRSQIAPKQLICKSDPWSSSSGALLNDITGKYYDGLTDHNKLSYSIAYPWAIGKSGPQPYWRDTSDTSIPLMSDMALQASDSTSKSPLDFNSPNHGGDGQNVGFADLHVDFYRDPLCGQSGDNIFGFGPADAAGSPHKFKSTTAAGTPFAPTSSVPPFDITMIPTRERGKKEWR
jgi:hypothetical protein